MFTTVIDSSPLTHCQPLVYPLIFNVHIIKPISLILIPPNHRSPRKTSVMAKITAFHDHPAVHITQPFSYHTVIVIATPTNCPSVPKEKKMYTLLFPI